MQCIKPDTHNNLTGYQTDGCRCSVCCATQAAYARNYSEERKKYNISYKMERGCSVCGYKEHPAALVFHHRDPATKTACVSRNWSMERLQVELSKCDILCSNCHAILHYGE